MNTKLNCNKLKCVEKLIDKYLTACESDYFCVCYDGYEIPYGAGHICVSVKDNYYYVYTVDRASKFDEHIFRDEDTLIFYIANEYYNKEYKEEYTELYNEIMNLLFNKPNQTMMTDLYELTMAQTYFENNGENKISYFDSFFRNIPFEGGYAIMGGCTEIIEYIKNLHFSKEDIKYLESTNLFTKEFLNYLENFKFTGDIYMIPDGTPVFANEPILTVKSNIIESQIIETALLSYLNAEIKFTTAAKRMTDVKPELPIMEFGARRADGIEAAVLASKCAVIGGCVGTSNVLAGQKYNLKIMGTMAHSLVTEAENEYEAFLKYAKAYPENTVFLVDTYDTLRSGIPNAIKVAQEYLTPNGYPFKGIRIDSGDLAYLSKEARKMLDEAGYKDTQICVSNGIDPHTLQSLLNQGAPIDSIGAGDNIAAPKERVGCVYKLVAIEENNKIMPKIKISDDALKTINPGFKKVYRFYSKETGYALGDLIASHDEEIEEDSYTLIDPLNELNQTTITNYNVRPLQTPIFINGSLVYEDPEVTEKRDYCTKQMETLYPEIRRLDKPHKYYVDLSPKVLTKKKQMVQKAKQK